MPGTQSGRHRLRSVIILMGLLVGSILARPAGGAEVREWQDLSGKFKVKASFKEVNDAGKVVIELEDGSVRNVVYEQLSAADQAYVAKLAPEENLVPVDETVRTGAGAPKRKSDVLAEKAEVTNDEKWEKWGWKAAVGGLLLLSIASIILLIDAFCVSVGWGIACFIVPFANIVYLVSHRHRPWCGRAGLMIFVGIGLSVGTVFGLGQAKRISETLKSAADNPEDPFGALELGTSSEGE